MPAPAQTPGSRAILDALPDAVVLTLVVALPAFLNLATLRIFEEEKALLLRAGALLILAGAVWSWREYVDVMRHPVVRLCGALILALAVSTATAIEPADAFFGAYMRRHGLLTWLALAAAFLGACRMARSEAGRRNLVAATVLGSVWPCAYALIQIAGADPVPWTDTIPGRAGSTLGNSLLMGGYLAAIIPITAIEAWRSPIYTACLILQLAALAATGSRGPLLALAAAGAFVIVAIPASRRRAVMVTLLGAAAAAALVILLVPAIRPVFLVRFFESTTGSGRVRILIWQGVRQVAGAGGWRWWVGYGPESLRHLFPPYYTPEIGQIEQTEAMPDRAHNELLDMLVGSGLMGVICELAFFAMVIVSALSVTDRRWRAGLAAAAIAHIAEIQLGIATVTSRLAFFTAAALVVGLGMPSAAPPVVRASKVAPPDPPLPWTPLMLAAAVSAIAPLLWVLHLRLVATQGSGGDAQALTSYLRTLSLASPIQYGLLLAAALVLARATAARNQTRRPLWQPLAVLGAALAIAIPVSVTASRADVVANAGAGFERMQQYREAAVAYGAADRLDPGEEVYLTNLGRVLTQSAAPLDEPARSERFMEARAVLERARASNRYSPYPPRNIASMVRLQARAAAPDARAALLNDADREYQSAVSRSAGLPALWTEWANVDAERRRFDEALTKIQRAIDLDATEFEPWLLRGLVHTLHRQPEAALKDFDRALALKAGEPAALRGRAAALAEIQRREVGLPRIR